MTDETKVQLEQLLSEYKILQDKLDKIGAFRFTVKGWSVTLVVASVFAASANRDVPSAFLLLLLVFPWLFFWVESEQSRLGFIFGERLFQLENDIRRVMTASIDANAKQHIRSAPRIAHHLHESRDSRKSIGKMARFISWVMNPNNAFYLVQTLAILAAFAVLYGRTSAYPQAQQSITIIKNDGLRGSENR